jgi:hypothetical protein
MRWHLPSARQIPGRWAGHGAAAARAERHENHDDDEDRRPAATGPSTRGLGSLRVRGCGLRGQRVPPGLLGRRVRPGLLGRRVPPGRLSQPERGWFTWFGGRRGFAADGRLAEIVAAAAAEPRSLVTIAHR